MSKYHEEYSLRHKVEFRPDEFADDPRTFAHPAIRIICAPNRYGIGDEQTWHRSQTPMPNHAHLPLYIMDHSAVHISLTPFARGRAGCVADRRRGHRHPRLRRFVRGHAQGRE